MKWQKVKQVINQLRKENPYPTSVFIEPSKEDWKLLNSICRINGKSSEAFMGSFGRIVWKNCLDTLEENFKTLLTQPSTEGDIIIAKSDKSSVEDLPSSASPRVSTERT